MAMRNAYKLIFFVEKRSQSAYFYKSHNCLALCTSLMYVRTAALLAASMRAVHGLATGIMHDRQVTGEGRNAGLQAVALFTSIK